MIYIGIDPGEDGALVIIKTILGKVYYSGFEECNIQIYDCPKTLQERRDLLESIAYGYGFKSVVAAIEKASKTIRIGAKTYHATVLWGNYQAWCGLLTGMDIKYEIVPARRWQTILDKNKKLNIKEQAWEAACRLYPEIVPKLYGRKNKKGEHAKKFGRSDALMIAEWARRNL